MNNALKVILLVLSLPVFALGQDVLKLNESTKAFNFELSYITDFLSNVRGGESRGSNLLGSMLLDFKLNAEEWGGWRGASFEASLLGTHGDPFTHRVGDFQTVSNIEAPQRVSLFRAFYEQKFWKDRVSLIMGLYNLDSEFDTRDTAELFLHSSPGTGGDIGQLGRNGPGIYPTGGLGGRLRFQDEGWYGQVAAMEGIPGDADDPFRFTLNLDGTEGLFIIGEAGRVWEDEIGRLGKIGAGAWGFTGGFETHLDPDAQVGNRGAYLTLEKTLFREKEDPSQNLSAYLRTGLADGRVNPIETFVGGGFVYTGLFSGRARDQIGISYNAGFTGDDFLASGDFDSHETALELTYSFVVNDYLSIQPDIQYIINPGFEQRLDNSLVLGLRIVSTFSSP